MSKIVVALNVRPQIPQKVQRRASAFSTATLDSRSCFGSRIVITSTAVAMHLRLALATFYQLRGSAFNSELCPQSISI